VAIEQAADRQLGEGGDREGQAASEPTRPMSPLQLPSCFARAFDARYGTNLYDEMINNGFPKQ